MTVQQSDERAERPVPPPARPVQQPARTRPVRREVVSRRMPEPEPVPVVMPVRQVVQPPQVLPVALAVPMAAAPPAPPRPAQRQAPAIDQFRNIMRMPGALGMAIIINEVLGPPRCRRLWRG